MAITDYPVSVKIPATPVVTGYSVSDVKQPLHMVGWEWHSLDSIEVSHYEVEIYDVLTGGTPLETRIIQSRESEDEIHRIFTIPERSLTGLDHDKVVVVPLDTKVIGAHPKAMYARVRAINWSGQKSNWTDRIKSEARRGKMLDRAPLASIKKVFIAKQTFEVRADLATKTDKEYHSVVGLYKIPLASDERANDITPILLRCHTDAPEERSGLLPKDRFSTVQVGVWTIPPINLRLGKIDDEGIEVVIDWNVYLHGPGKDGDIFDINLNINYEYI